MKEYVKFENSEMGVLICTDYNKLIFWCEYEIATAIGTFHNNSPVCISLLNGTTAKVINPIAAKTMLLDIAKATAKTSASRYAFEIEQFLKDVFDEECPF